jgi:hypothetical protein
LAEVLVRRRLVLDRFDFGLLRFVEDLERTSVLDAVSRLIL